MVSDDAVGGSLLGKHAVYPGTFDPLTSGHLDIIERARHLFGRVTVLVAVNADKRLAGTPSERSIRVRRELPADWDNVAVAAWSGMTVSFCRQHGADVIIRGARNRSDLDHEYQLAAMNEVLGITTLLLPADPGLAAVSSTIVRGLGARRQALGRRDDPLGMMIAGFDVVEFRGPVTASRNAPFARTGTAEGGDRRPRLRRPAPRVRHAQTGRSVAPSVSVR